MNWIEATYYLEAVDHPESEAFFGRRAITLPHINNKDARVMMSEEGKACWFAYKEAPAGTPVSLVERARDDWRPYTDRASAHQPGQKIPVLHPNYKGPTKNLSYREALAALDRLPPGSYAARLPEYEDHCCMILSKSDANESKGLYMDHNFAKDEPPPATKPRPPISVIPIPRHEQERHDWMVFKVDKYWPPRNRREEAVQLMVDARNILNELEIEKGEDVRAQVGWLTQAIYYIPPPKKEETDHA
jgi:hypothetical protein